MFCSPIDIQEVSCFYPWHRTMPFSAYKEAMKYKRKKISRGLAFLRRDEPSHDTELSSFQIMDEDRGTSRIHKVLLRL